MLKLARVLKCAAPNVNDCCDVKNLQASKRYLHERIIDGKVFKSNESW